MKVMLFSLLCRKRTNETNSNTYLHTLMLQNSHLICTINHNPRNNIIIVFDIALGPNADFLCCTWHNKLQTFQQYFKHYNNVMKGWVSFNYSMDIKIFRHIYLAISKSLTMNQLSLFNLVPFVFNNYCVSDAMGILT